MKTISSFFKSGLPVVLVAGSLALPSRADAADGLYAGLGVGYGTFTGKALVVTDTGVGDRPNLDPAVCCPSGGLGFGVRVGYALFGVVAPEFVFLGNGWDIGSDMGGGGFIGGGLRAYPLGMLTRVGLDTKDIPIDLAIGGAFGYHVIGKDFAYTGSFFGLDFSAEYILSETISIGARFNYVMPTYSNFVFTDYNGNMGRCLDAAGAQDGETAPFSKGSQVCSGNGPSASFIAPELIATFHFQLF